MSKTSDVLVIAKGIPPMIGGIEAYSAEVASAYAARGHRVELLTPGFHQVLGPDGRVDRLSGPTEGRAQLMSFLSILWRLVRMGQRGPRLAHATSWRMAIPWLLMGRGGKLIVTLHGREVTEQSRPLQFLARGVLKRSDLLVYVSRSSQEQIQRTLPSLRSQRSVVAWNGVSSATAERQGPIPAEGRIRILTVCRLVRRKNLLFALAAVAELARRVEEASLHYVIVGDGPMRQQLEAEVSSLVSNALIELTGSVSEQALHDHYARADIFFHPQSSAHDPRDIEGFGLSIVDAMAYGVPVVCGQDGGPSEYVVHEENGFLVNGEDVDQSAAILHRLVVDPELRQRVGSRGRSLVYEKMTWARHVSAIEAAAIDGS